MLLLLLGEASSIVWGTGRDALCEAFEICVDYEWDSHFLEKQYEGNFPRIPIFIYWRLHPNCFMI